MENEWSKVKLVDIIQFNPKESIKKGEIAKKVAMEKLEPFTRKISGFEEAKFTSGTKFRNGDTLLARITPCLENGKTAQVDILDKDEIGFGSTEYIVLREKLGITDNDFIYYLSISPEFRNVAIKAMNGSSGRQRVQKDVLENSEFLLPPLDEQKAIAKILSDLDEKIGVNNKINKKLEEMVQAIFKQWFVDFEFPNEDGKPYKSSGGEMVESELGMIPKGWNSKSLLDIADYLNGLAMQKFRPEDDEKGIPVLKIKELRQGKSDDEKDQKEFKQFATELAKAHALCAATDEGKEVALEVSYFKAVKASLVKLDTKKVVKKSKQEMEARVNQLLEKSIISEEVIDVFDTLGIKRPDVSILSEEFLEEVKGMKEKNLAAEMLKKLLEGNLKAMERTNLVKSEKFSEKLKKTLNKYRNQAITNAEVIEELIKMAHDLKNMKTREEELGLNSDEIAFYDALTDDAVKEFMTDETLKMIAHELTYAIRRNISIDWSIRKSAQAGMRRIIKRLLKKYDYPPDKSKKALETVLRQAELMCGNVDFTDEEYAMVAEKESKYTV